jgi:hypothetical protein
MMKVTFDDDSNFCKSWHKFDDESKQIVMLFIIIIIMIHLIHFIP